MWTLIEQVWVGDSGLGGIMNCFMSQWVVHLGPEHGLLLPPSLGLLPCPAAKAFLN